MKLKVVIGALASSVLLAACNGEKKEEQPAPLQLDTNVQKVSYIQGYRLSRQLAELSFELDASAMKAGIEDHIAGKESVFTEEEIRTVMVDFQNQMAEKQKELRNKQDKERKAAAAANAEEGEEFLAANAEKEGVVVTDSGLQYRVITEGTGAKPTSSDKVTVNYRGTLIDGSEFDSSYSRGKPATFGVGQVIPGWTEALQLMSEGSKWELYIPADLAYGAVGAPPSIEPNSTLLFEVDFLHIGEPKPEASEEAAEEEPAEG